MYISIWYFSSYLQYFYNKVIKINTITKYNTYCTRNVPEVFILLDGLA